MWVCVTASPGTRTQPWDPHPLWRGVPEPAARWGGVGPAPCWVAVGGGAVGLRRPPWGSHPAGGGHLGVPRASTPCSVPAPPSPHAPHQSCRPPSGTAGRSLCLPPLPPGAGTEPGGCGQGAGVPLPLAWGGGCRQLPSEGRRETLTEKSPCEGGDAGKSSSCFSVGDKTWRVLLRALSAHPTRGPPPAPGNLSCICLGWPGYHSPLACLGTAPLCLGSTREIFQSCSWERSLVSAGGKGLALLKVLPRLFLPTAGLLRLGNPPWELPCPTCTLPCVWKYLGDTGQLCGALAAG